LRLAQKPLHCYIHRDIGVLSAGFGGIFGVTRL